jgi:hypothetical protein
MATPKRESTLSRFVLSRGERTIGLMYQEEPSPGLGMTPKLAACNVVYGPCDVPADRLADAREHPEIMIGELAFAEWCNRYQEYCRGAQSIPGLRLALELDDNPARRAAAQARIAELKAG